MRLAMLGFFFHILGQLLEDDRIHNAFDIRIDQFFLGLSLELRIGHANGNDGDQTFAKVIARRNNFFEQLFALAVIVNGSRQCGSKPAKVRSPQEVVDAVSERPHSVVETIVVLDCDSDFDVFLQPIDPDDRFIQGRLGTVQPAHEFDDPVRVTEFVMLAGAFVEDSNLDTGIQKCQFL